MTTREEDDFEGLVVTLLNCEADAAWHKRCGTYDDATIAAMERRDEAWAAVFAVYDAQAAEIRLVRERNAELAAQRLEADDRAYYEGRIAELEAALRAVLPWLLHEIEYPGDPVEKVANGVRALLSKEA